MTKPSPPPLRYIKESGRQVDFEDRMDGYWNDHKWKFKWKIVEKKTRSSNLPTFLLYKKIWFFWDYYAEYESLELAKLAARHYEKFLEREQYEKDVWSN